MKKILLTIPERLQLLKALNIKTGLIDTILVNLIIAKINFDPQEIDYASLKDGLKGAVTWDVSKPIIKVVMLSECELSLFLDRFGTTAEYNDLKGRIITEV